MNRNRCRDTAGDLERDGFELEECAGKCGVPSKFSGRSLWGFAVASVNIDSDDFKKRAPAMAKPGKKWLKNKGSGWEKTVKLIGEAAGNGAKLVATGLDSGFPLGLRQRFRACHILRPINDPESIMNAVL